VRPLLLSALLFSQALQAQLLPVPPAVTAHRDLAYVTGGHERQKLDLYVPDQGDKLPLVVWVHGGGWESGDKSQCLTLPLTAQGFAAASIGYRLSQHAVFPAQIEDCKAAVRWLRRHAAEYRIDPDRIGAFGISAGGHLVALMGTSGDVKDFDVGENLQVSSRVQAVCDMCGPTDLLRFREKPSTIQLDAKGSLIQRLFGGAIQERLDVVKRFNPITWISKDDPPFLILHGDADPLVPLSQSQLLADALRAQGLPVEMHIEKGGGHVFFSSVVNAKIASLFDRTLKAAVQ